MVIILDLKIGVQKGVTTRVKLGILGQEADLVTDWCMSVIPCFSKHYSLDPIKVGQRKIVSIELLKHFPKGRLRVIDEFLGCTPPS